MPARIPCEFSLIRYVPDVVKGEFVNIGVVLREAAGEVAGELPRGAATRNAATQVRFTRDWRRVRCIDPAADTDLLESLEEEIAALLLSEASGPAPPRPLLHLLSDTLSNSIQITEPRATLAESFALELEQLMRLYIEPIRMKVAREKTGRAAIAAAMRREFERAGVWPLMRKRIAAAPYTRRGDPMKLDCGYRPESKAELKLGGGVIRIFHAVSLENDAEAAKGLAYSAPQLREGLMRLDNAALDLAAVVEPIRGLSGRRGPGDDSADDFTANDFTDEAADLYRFGVAAMESAAIRVLTVNDLARAAETARMELRL
jgi:hypothetical protein